MDREGSRIRAWQLSTRMRSLVLACLMAGFSYFMWRPVGPGALSGGMNMFAAGLAIQIAVLFAMSLVKRHIADAELAAQSNYIIELVADAITVLLFVIGTIRAISLSSDSL